MAGTYAIRGQTFTGPDLPAALYVAATPIGNLGDVTLRLLDALAACDVIACEDTRVTSKLLNHYAIRNKTVAYHEHNAEKAGPALIADIASGKSVVLVSDAGTPLVSDPGFRLVRQAREQGIDVVSLPGASAALAALVASGLPSETWLFCGFLSNKKSARMKSLEGYRNRSETLIFYESPNRLLQALEDMVETFGETCKACVARELTKMHEEITLSTLGELITNYAGKPVRGEIVILVSPSPHAGNLNPRQLLIELLAEQPVSRAATQAAELTGLPKRDLYQLALELKDGNGE